MIKEETRGEEDSNIVYRMKICPRSATIGIEETREEDSYFIIRRMKISRFDNDS